MSFLSRIWNWLLPSYEADVNQELLTDETIYEELEGPNSTSVNFTHTETDFTTTEAFQSAPVDELTFSEEVVETLHETDSDSIEALISGEKVDCEAEGVCETSEEKSTCDVEEAKEDGYIEFRKYNRKELGKMQKKNLRYLANRLGLKTKVKDTNSALIDNIVKNQTRILNKMAAEATA